MTTVGINGHLMDAVFKARALQCYPRGSVHLIVTPCCRPLLEFFRRIRSVSTVEVDQTSEYRGGHGEQTSWTHLPELDTTYPGYPSEWCVNYVASYCGLPRIRREDWFGSFRYVLGEIPEEDFAVYAEGVSDPKGLLSTVAKIFPGLSVVSADPTKDCIENIRRSAQCAIRVVGFDAAAAIMSAVGLTCIVDRGDRPSGRYDELFLSFGERVVSSGDLFCAITDAVNAATIRHHRSDQNWLYPRVAICMSTLSREDLTGDSVATLTRQLRSHDAIFVLDNGQNVLADPTTRPEAHVFKGDRNLGLASYWNQLLEHTLLVGAERRFDWALLLKSDMSLRVDQLQSIKKILAQAAAQRKWMVVGPCLGSLVAVNRACIENVGLFDTALVASHFEDNDYYRRLCLIDPDRCLVADKDFEPEMKCSSVTFNSCPEMADFAESRLHYLEKWGGLPGSERFVTCYGRQDMQRPDRSTSYAALPAANAPAIVLICLSTYHRTKTLARAIESLREQTYHWFEAWIAKDGCQDACSIDPRSSDGTCLECDECQKTIAFAQRICDVDQRFRFFCLSTNFGGGGWGPRNFIIMNTSHPLIAYLDDDNWYEPDHLESLVQVLLDSGADLAFTGTTFYRDSLVVGHRFHNRPPFLGGIDTSEILHRRELIARSGGWRDDRLYGPCDWDLVERWMRFGVKWAHTGKITVNYSVRP
jgi:hypothetical protein